MKTLRFCATFLAAVLSGPSLFATTYIMGYPPAGGVTLTPSGSSIGSTGGTFAYSNFNSSAYQTLYYGVNTVANVAQSDVMNPGNMTFNGYASSSGILVWVSTQPWSFIDGVSQQVVSTQTQFIVQLQPFTGSNAGFLGSGFLTGLTTTKGALGIGGTDGPLFQVANAGAFQATFQFQTWDGSSGNIGQGQDLADFYASHNGGSNSSIINTSVDFEFWWSVQKTIAKKVQVGTCLTSFPSYATINTAVNAVPSGATILICPGTYPEQITINEPLTLQGTATGSNQSVILAVPAAGLNQNGTGPVSSFPIAAQIMIQDAGPVNITGLTLDGSSSSCPNGATAGVVFLSTAAPASGKFSNSVIRNTANACGSPQAAAVYSENGSGMASNITIQGNSIHSINGQGVVFGPNVSGTISGNTIHQASGGLAFQNAGPAVKVSANYIVSTQNAISLNSATGVIAQSNTLINTSNKAISLNDSSGGSNNVTKNTINEGSCGISTSNAASTDVFLPNNVLNMAATICP